MFGGNTRKTCNRRSDPPTHGEATDHEEFSSKLVDNIFTNRLCLIIHGDKSACLLLRMGIQLRNDHINALLLLPITAMDSAYRESGVPVS